MKTLIAALLLLLIPGCVWPVHTTKGPMGKGTWQGVIEPLTLRNNEGKTRDVAAMQIASGPAMKNPDGTAYAMPAETRFVLLDKDGNPLTLEYGKRVEVTGKMFRSASAGVPELGPLPTVPAIYVDGEPKLLP